MFKGTIQYFCAKMFVWLLSIVFFTYWGNSTAYKIPISRCLTPYGFDGYCRPVEDCVGVDHFEASNCRRGLICCNRGDLSRRKCYQYAELVFASDTGMSLMAHSPPSQKVDTCAMVAVPLIVGGEKAQQKEFPHQAVLGYGDSMDSKENWECGGSLISENFIVSAAHCAMPDRRPKFARLGITNLFHDLNYQQIYPIEDIIIHPNYNKMLKVNDIALIRLSRKVKFTPYVRPACLDYFGLIDVNRAIATGFGRVGHGGKQSPDLLKVTLDILNRDECHHTVKRQLKDGLRTSQICAGFLAGGKDTCQGDSGGPLQTVKKTPYCMYSIIGLTSYGIMCGFQFSPAIYTRVWSFIPWIEAVVWPNQI